MSARLASGPFDTFTGLPLHILVVHLVVVLVPLMSVATPAVLIVARWRRLLPWVVAGNVVATVSAWVAVQAGNQLFDRVSKAQNGQGLAPIEHHENLGNLVPWFALIVLVVSAIAWLVLRQASIPAAVLPVMMVLAVAAGVLSLQQVIRTGDAGSRAAWAELVKNT